MAGRGLRSILQPILFVGIASILHGILFLIPAGEPTKRDSETTRGIRLKAYVEARPAASPAPRAVAQPSAAPRDAPEPNVTTDRNYSMAGKDAARGGKASGGESGSEGGPHGDAGLSKGPVVGSGGQKPQSEFGDFVKRLGSADVQGFARESAKASRRGWKGSGEGSGGWGSGSGAGSGSGKGRGTGPGGGGGAAYMDPRVRMVIIQYPVDGDGNAVVEKARNIENRFRQIPYPDLKIKKSEYTTGWWNVYIELWTTDEGKVERYNVLRPETKGALERIFVAQVSREVERWTFEPGRAEVHVDVRFYVE